MTTCKCGKSHRREDTLHHCPFEPVFGDRPKQIRQRGWCPTCKERLEDCVCGAREPGSVFDKAAS